jgi:hypothetical protein
MSQDETQEPVPVEPPGCDQPRRNVLKGLGLTASVAAAGFGPRLLWAGNASQGRPAARRYLQLYQWTLIDEKGTREFPGWRPGEPEVWCYTEKMSYTEGDGVDLRVHTNCKTFAIKVVRAGGTPQTVLEQGGIRGTSQHTPQDAAIKGCGWKPSFSIETGGWRPGVYVVHLEARDAAGKSAEGEHFFVVQPRQAGSWARTCLVLSTSTFQAYNDWGGANHYRSIREGISTDILEPRLSTQRPWGRGFVAVPADAPDSIDPNTPPPGWHPEYPEVLWPLAHHYSRHYVEGYATYAARFIPWLERNGYPFEVATQHDLHQRPEMFKNYKCLLFIGHDEYWSWEMRDTLDHFVDAGGKVARFGGNFWCQVRLEDGGKTHVCYKSDADPILETAQKSRAAIGWDTPEVNRPAAQTFGLHATGYSRYGATTPRSPGGFTVYRPWHWAFEKTDLYYGDTFGNAPINVFGFEVDGIDYRIEHGLPEPTGSDHPPQNLQILALALAVSGEPDRWGGKVLLNAPLDYASHLKKKADAGEKVSDEEEQEHAHDAAPTEPGAETAGRLSAGMMSYFERGKGEVFCAGSCTWVRGLVMDDFFTQQITRNVLKRFGVGS